MAWSEHQHQVEVCRFLDAAGVVYFAVPNGGKRNKVTAARLKAEGVKAGVPDLIIVTIPPIASLSRHPIRGCVVEMKTPKGSCSDDQISWGKIFLRHNWWVITGYGAIDAIEKLRELGYG